ncbi:MAG: hypothetical protein K940chlam7_01278 [Chlamydiae bacterium]|nr:hypothetical protein [Chlamydiota bacterium]
MNLHKKNLIFAFISTLLATLFSPIIFPSYKLLFFGAFLVILYYRKPFVTCLWGSLLCGLLFDLLSSHPRLGIYAINFTATTWVLYPQRRNFFADSLSTLPVMTFLFSVISTVFQGFLLYAFEGQICISKNWFLSDLFLMPLFDAVFAFCYFILPFVFFGKPIRKGKDYFLQKE